jgi:hypothetical protein
VTFKEHNFNAISIFMHLNCFKHPKNGLCMYRRKLVDKYGQDTEESSFQAHKEKDKPLFGVNIGYIWIFQHFVSKISVGLNVYSLQTLRS